MSKLKSLPLSKAKTAYGLLQDVKRAMLAEPKRVTMTCFVGKQAPEENGPACGTVGCFAGWVNLLSGNFTPCADDDNAKNVLGYDLNYFLQGDGENLERNETFYVFNGGFGDGITGLQQGTRRYAQAVVRRINRFIKVNEKALRARKLGDK
jgi:hypothetical protein